MCIDYLYPYIKKGGKGGLSAWHTSLDKLCMLNQNLPKMWAESLGGYCRGARACVCIYTYTESDRDTASDCLDSNTSLNHSAHINNI